MQRTATMYSVAQKLDVVRWCTVLVVERFGIRENNVGNALRRLSSCVLSIDHSATISRGAKLLRLEGDCCVLWWGCPLHPESRKQARA